MTAEEKATQQVQAAPLGLNGDTVKKKKEEATKGAGEGAAAAEAEGPEHAIPQKNPDRHLSRTPYASGGRQNNRAPATLRLECTAPLTTEPESGRPPPA